MNIPSEYEFNTMMNIDFAIKFWLIPWNLFSRLEITYEFIKV